MRTFIAIELPGAAEPFERASSLVRSELGAGARDWSFVMGALHVTLAFLGEIAPEQAGRASQAVVSAVEGRAPFELELAGGGAFPTAARPRVLWIGARAGSEPLAAIAQVLRERLAGAGFSIDRRPFHPHLTLARARRGARPGGVTRVVAGMDEVALGRWPVSEIVLLRSELRREGALHHALARVPIR